METSEASSQHMCAAFIIVNYNGAKYLPDLFSSLGEMDFPKDSCDIFFVDNASSDNSLEWAREHAGALGRTVVFLESKENLGFAGGNNLAMRKALEEGYTYIVLLNQDTIVDPQWLRELLAVAESDESIGAVQSLLLLAAEPERINSAGNELHYLGFGWVGQHKKKFRISDFGFRILDIGYASGAAVLYRAEALKKAGLFDERFFMYHEDIDLSWRIRLAGYKVALAPRSLVYHKYSFKGQTQKQWWKLEERNRWIVLLTLYQLRTLFLFMPVLLFMEVGVVMYSIINGWFRYKVKSYGEVFACVPYIMQKRKGIKRLRRISDREILSHMTSVFSFPEMKHPLIQYIANPVISLYFQLVMNFVR